MAIVNLLAMKVNSPLNAMLHIVALGGSAVLCFMVGFPAIRRRRRRAGDLADQEDTVAEHEGAQMDAFPDEGEDN